MEKFEYRVMSYKAEGFFGGGSINSENFQEQLNALGAEGWELVSSATATGFNDRTRYVISIFKRRAR